jgi:hypothetical protein
MILNITVKIFFIVILPSNLENILCRFAKYLPKYSNGHVPFPLQIAPPFRQLSINVSRAGIIDSPPSSEKRFAPHI